MGNFFKFIRSGNPAPELRVSEEFTYSGKFKVAPKDQSTHKTERLGPWLATGICGNDITSSCLYVAAIATAYSGIYAPLVLLMVAGLLYIYRTIYAEVGDALPLNGGAYNALLNTTTKFKASIAACMTFLSYLATACISSNTAIEYLGTLFPVAIPVIPLTIGLLGAFAVLAIMGISESAKVALVIFLFHLCTLALFILLGVLFIFGDFSIAFDNWKIPQSHGLIPTLFLGFSAALLGISGFESSANYIEEQKEGVFPVTLRNMWVAVTVLNPVIAMVAIGVLPIDTIIHDKKFMLASAGMQIQGSWLKTLISIDAFLVLSGAVLTAYVGSSGLVGRMALDRCLPQFLLKKNKRGSQHYIILTFFFLCASILYITQGDLLALGGVYTISFLGVMSLFAVGNALLKIRRSRLPRKYRATWIAIAVALLSTCAGIIGNIQLKSENVRYFLMYFIPTVSIVFIMLNRHNILRLILHILLDLSKGLRGVGGVHDKIQAWLDHLESQRVIFFTKGDDAANLNQAMLYVKDNEITNRITVIHLYDEIDHIPKHLKSDLRTLDKLYPEMDIELVLLKGSFTPEKVDEISTKYNIPKNYMFLGAPSAKFPYALADLGGVRLII
ncbi:MAG: APC family permease [Bdellovibrionales bacterium]|nr:APC family permease [Bdellovibrionales bacterium]